MLCSQLSFPPAVADLGPDLRLEVAMAAVAVHEAADPLSLRVSVDGLSVYDAPVELGSGATECSVSFRGGPEQRAVEAGPGSCVELGLEQGQEGARCCAVLAAETGWSDTQRRPGFCVRTWTHDIALGSALYTGVVEVLHVAGTDVALLHAVRLMRRACAPAEVARWGPALRGPAPATYVPRARLATRVWDGCLAPAACTALLSDAAHLVQHHRCDPGRNTRWVPATGPSPRCTIERLARAVFNLHTAELLSGLSAEEQERTLQTSGAEWWVQFRSSEDQPGARDIRFHFDRDEDLARRYGVDRNPLAATVTYLTDTGAPTLLLPLYDRDGRGGEEGLAHAAGDGGVVLSYPVSGKHLVFDGRLLHGCPARLARAAESVAGSSWERVSLLVNVWIGHRPLAAADTSDSLAAELSNVCAQDVFDVGGAGAPSPVCTLDAPGSTEEVNALPRDMRPGEWAGAAVSLRLPSAERLAASAGAGAQPCSTLHLLGVPLQVVRKEECDVLGAWVTYW